MQTSLSSFRIKLEKKKKNISRQLSGHIGFIAQLPYYRAPADILGTPGRSKGGNRAIPLRRNKNHAYSNQGRADYFGDRRCSCTRRLHRFHSCRLERFDQCPRVAAIAFNLISSAVLYNERHLCMRVLQNWACLFSLQKLKMHDLGSRMLARRSCGFWLRKTG